MLVSIESIDKFYLGNPVLQQVSATIEDHDRIGLIGANGAGKSTLLRLICDLESPDAGEIARSAKVTIGFLQQNSGLESNNTILEEMKSVFSDLLKIQSQMKQIEVRLADESLKSNPEEYQRLTQEYAHQQTYFEQRDGYLTVSYTHLNDEVVYSFKLYYRQFQITSVMMQRLHKLITIYLFNLHY